MANSKQWRYINRLRAGSERRYSKQFNKSLNVQIIPVLKSIEESGIYETIEKIDTLITAESITETYVKLYKDVGLRFARITRRGMKDEDQWLEDVLERLTLVSDPVQARIVTVTETSRGQALKIIEETLQDGIEDGLGIPEIARNIRDDVPKEWKKINKFRARRIAQTEVVSASNYGSLTGARATGLSVNKIWLTGGGNIRPAHLNAEGESVPIDQPFIQTGEEMDFPGDPRGSSENVINCKCAIAYETFE